MSGTLSRRVRTHGYGNIVLVQVRGRRSGMDRPVLLGLLEVGDRRYLGHPNGDTDWTRNVRAAGRIEIQSAGVPMTSCRTVVLAAGPERDAVVRAAFHQHPFPAGPIYRLAARHVLSYGVYFRLEPDGRPEPGSPGG
jgi:hypothetical protein